MLFACKSQCMIVAKQIARIAVLDESSLLWVRVPHIVSDSDSAPHISIYL